MRFFDYQQRDDPFFNPQKWAYDKSHFFVFFQLFRIHCKKLQQKYNKNNLFLLRIIFFCFFHVFSLVAIPCFFDKIPKKLFFPRNFTFYKKTA
jgi:hypothetical protein